MPLLASACFEDPATSTETGTETGDGDGDPGDGDPGDGDPGDGDGEPGDGDGEPGDGDGEPGDGDGEADPGPQIVSSTPNSDDQNAGLDPYFLLYFDRVVDDGDATGKVLVSQGGAAPTPVSIQPCPDLDPTCVAGLYPMALLQDGRLPPDTNHEIIVTAGFEDPDGVETTVDQVVPFKTFPYEPNFFDDSSALPDVGGIAYDPGSQSLFVSGVNSNEFYGPRVRRIPIPNGSPMPAATVLEVMPGGGGPWVYGLDRYGNQLFVPMTYAGQVRTYTNLGGAALTQVDLYDQTGLPEPNADVEEVWSVARSQDGRTFFSWGNFHGGVNGSGVMQVSQGGTWSMFNDGMNLWNNSDDGVMIVVGMVGNVEFLFASADGKLYKFRTADGQLAATYEVPQSWSRDLEIDSQGRLWYATAYQGVYVYDVSADNQITELAKRGGLPCPRMALREQPNVMHVYCVGTHDAVISHLPVEL
ncbi:MAG TPA: hypothetical protein VK034_19675 [Enhygromyxa sp.]|nr:hypothetical protein [Enhygromyxa sp.]